MLELIDSLAHRVEESDDVSRADLLAVLAHAHHGETIPIKAAKEQGADIAPIGRAGAALLKRVRTQL